MHFIDIVKKKCLNGSIYTGVEIMFILIEYICANSIKILMLVLRNIKTFIRFYVLYTYLMKYVLMV